MTSEKDPRPPPPPRPTLGRQGLATKEAFKLAALPEDPWRAMWTVTAGGETDRPRRRAHVDIRHLSIETMFGIYLDVQPTSGKQVTMVITWAPEVGRLITMIRTHLMLLEDPSI